MKSIYIVAGEASGDLHGSHLATSLKKKDPLLKISSAGGHSIRKHTDGEFVETAHLNVTGITEVIRHLPHYFHLFGRVIASIKRVKPDLVVFIDNPGFNLRLAHKIAKLKIPMAYYICPQVWAWAKSRIFLLKRLFVKTLVVFEFEEALYKKHGVPVSWVGHPLADEVDTSLVDRRKPSISPRIILMPGSRRHEVERLLPVMIRGSQNILKSFPAATFFIVRAQTIPLAFYARMTLKAGVDFRIIEERKYSVMRGCDLVLVCSGTATLECGLLRLPMIVLYRTSWITYLIAKYLVKGIRFLAIPNIVAQKQIVPELIQHRANAGHLTREALNILLNPEVKKTMGHELDQALTPLAAKGASDTAAQELLNIMNRSESPVYAQPSA